MEKVYERINWSNFPSEETPINETNLNKMDRAINELDNRVLGLDSAKLDKSTADKKFAETDSELEALDTAKLDKTTANTMIAELKMKNDAKGENIHLQDSDKANVVALSLFGKSEQKQYIGKNLIPYPHDYEYPYTNSGVTFTYDEETGYITANGTANSTVANYAVMNIQIRNDTKTPFYLPIGRYKASGCPSGGGNGKYRIAIGYTNESGSYSAYGTDDGNGFEFEVTKEKLSTQVQLCVYNGYTANNLVFKPMIRLASITDDTYEPYVGGSPSPNPNYPQEINVAGKNGSVEVKNVGKNLIPFPYYDKTVSNRNGVNWTADNNGIISATGKASENANSDFAIFSKRKLEAGTYSISGFPSGCSSSTYFVFLNYYENNNYVTSKWFAKDTTFTLTQEDVNKYTFVLGARVTKNASVENIVFKPMIRPVDIVDDTYEQYKESKITISTPTGLVGIPVDSEGNYTDENGQQWICDEIVKYADGSGKRIQRIGEVIIDETYANTLGSNAQSLRIVGAFNNAIVPKNNNEAPKFVSKYYVAVPYADANNHDYCMTYLYEYSRGYLVNKDMTSLQDWKTSLKETNIPVQYILATPIVTDLTAGEIAEIEKLQTFYPVTNISNNANCGMSITYVADTKNYIDSKIASLEKALYNNI